MRSPLRTSDVSSEVIHLAAVLQDKLSCCDAAAGNECAVG